MTDIVQLGFEIDTAALNQAKTAAVQLADALGKVADAADKQAAAEKGKAAATQQGAQASQQGAQAATAAATATKGAAEATKAATTAAQGHAQAAQKDAEATKQQQAAQSGLAATLGATGQAMAAAGAQVQTVTGHMIGLNNVLGAGGGGGGIAGGLTAAAGGMGSFGARLGPVAGGLVTFGAGVVSVAGGLTALITTTAKQEEKFALLEARLKNVYGSGAAATEMFAKITALASQNGVAIDQTAESFLRLARNNEAIGLSRREMVDLTDAVQKLGRVSGASTGELSSGMMQFSQALAAGKLNGDELRSIMENMPALAKAIADGLGVSVGQIRAMGAEGQLTSDKITGAILKQLPKINEEFKNLPQTSEQSFTRVANEWDKLVAGMGKRLNSSGILVAVGETFAKGIAAANDLLTAQPQYDADKQGRIAEQVRNITPEWARTGNGFAAQRLRDAEMAASQAGAYDYGERARNDAMQSRAQQQREALRAPVVRSGAIVQELDSIGTKAKNIREQIATLEQANANFIASPFLFEPQEEERLKKYPGYIAALKAQLEDLRTPLDAFRKATADQQGDVERFGAGGAASLGPEFRTLLKQSNAAGESVTEAEALNAVLARRAVEIDTTTKAMEGEIDAQRRLVDVVGKGKQAEIEAEIATKAHNLQMQMAGREITPQLSAALDKYKDNLRQLLNIQKDATDQQKLYNSQTELGIQKALSAAQANGANAGQLRELERQLRLNAKLQAELGGGSGGVPATSVPSVPSVPQRRTGDPDSRAPVASTGGGITANVRAGVDTAGMTSAIRDIINAIAREFPNAVLTSGVRNGNGRSQHDHANAGDFNLKDLTRDERMRLTQRITSGEGAFAQVGGMGMYDPTGNLLHVDARGGDRRIWGPSRSKDSIGQTPDFFQAMAEAWQKGQNTPSVSRATVEREGSPGVRNILTEEAAQREPADRAERQRLEELRRERRELERQISAPDAVAARTRRNEDTAKNYAKDFAPDQQAIAYQEKLNQLQRESQLIVAETLRDKDAEIQKAEMTVTAEGKTGIARRAALKTIEDINRAKQQGINLTEEETAALLKQNTALLKQEKRNAEAAQEASEYEKIWTTTADAIGGAIETAFRDAVMTGKVDAQKILKSLVADIGSQIIKAFTAPLINSLVGSLSGFFGSANGNVFDGGARMAFAAGGIIDSPRMFPMANGGTGLAGEAGPEAIMPLKRGPDGKLGVAGGGGGGSKTTIIVNDMRTAQGSQQVETSEEQGPDGQRIVQIMVRDEVRRQIGAGETDGAMRANYGITRTLTKR